MSSTNVFKRAELQVKAMNVQDNLQHQNLKITSKKHGK
jgi:hypothetical protein